MWHTSSAYFFENNFKYRGGDILERIVQNAVFGEKLIDLWLKVIWWLCMWVDLSEGVHYQREGDVFCL